VTAPAVTRAPSPEMLALACKLTLGGYTYPCGKANCQECATTEGIARALDETRAKALRDAAATLCFYCKHPEYAKVDELDPLGFHVNRDGRRVRCSAQTIRALGEVAK
jgi:hypothetical protein